MIIDINNINDIRKLILKAKKDNPNEEIIVKAKDDEFNRKILEHKEVDILLSPEFHFRKDYKKQRDSGLNEFLLRLAKQNNKIIAIDLGLIKRLDKKDKARILSRVIQNIRLANKIGAKLILWPKNAYKKQDILAFFTSLNGSTKQASISFPNQTKKDLNL